MTLILATLFAHPAAPLALLGLLAVLALLGTVEAFPAEEFRKGLGEIKTGIGAHKKQLTELESALQGVQQ